MLVSFRGGQFLFALTMAKYSAYIKQNTPYTYGWFAVLFTSQIVNQASRMTGKGVVMPMSEDFKERLFPKIPQIYKDFRPVMAGECSDPLDGALSDGFHIYDELGIRSTVQFMKHLFFSHRKGTNYFAVKACPNISLLKVLLEMGFGLDCASPTELFMAKAAGAKGEQVMYTSNNTNPIFFGDVLEFGAIMNLDDITLIDELPYMPELISFRYNPGERRVDGTDGIIGNPPDQKYGLTHDQIVEGYRRAKAMGAKRFGIHTMFASNSLDARVLAGNLKMQLEIIEMVQNELDIMFEFVNIGGGLGICYNPNHEDPEKRRPLDIYWMARLVDDYFDQFQLRNGYVPRFYIESGRYVTGPHGALVAPVINIMDKYKPFVGVSICDGADLLRSGIYESAYHEASVVSCIGGDMTDFGDTKTSVSIVGPLCENMHMVKNRPLPPITKGDFIVMHDTGAHGIAMGMNYNGWGKSQELLLKPDGSVVRIARAQTVGDILAMQLCLPQVISGGSIVDPIDTSLAPMGYN